uniref:Uncharacterized protein n=1 Tax=Amphimedon queenslandica TaxID=400682 RepID=A0A1X7THK0_AMPQE
MLKERLYQKNNVCTKLKLLLAMSFALLPIPAEAVDKVERGVLIDLKELLHNNVALFNTLQELGSSAPTSVQRMRDIHLRQCLCMTETRDLMAYGKVMARNHRCLGWVSYNKPTKNGRNATTMVRSEFVTHGCYCAGRGFTHTNPDVL